MNCILVQPHAIIVTMMHVNPLKPMEVEHDFKAHRSNNTVNVCIWRSLTLQEFNDVTGQKLDI